MMIRGRRDRRRAQELQDALERYERACGAPDAGGQDVQTRARAAEGLGEIGRTFALAVALGDAAAEITPDETFARRVAMQLRSAQYATRAKPRRAPRFSLAPLALAAAAVIAAVVLIPSFRALPGDPLYAVKGSAEDARVWWARGQGEARVRVDVANERFEEVERLVDRSRVIVSGLGVSAASAADIDDPELARLIETALQDAGRQLEAAADILTSEPAPKEDIAQLLQVTQRGRELTAEVVHELPMQANKPMLRTDVKLAKIEAKAKAAQTTEAVEETPPPCSSPSTSPSPTPTATPTEDAGASPSASPTMTPTIDETEESPEADTEPTPEPTPCTSPEPTPTPTTTEEPASSEAPPTGSPEVQGSSVENEPDGHDSDVSEEPEPTPQPGSSPLFERA